MGIAYERKPEYQYVVVEEDVGGPQEYNDISCYITCRASCARNVMLTQPEIEEKFSTATVTRSAR